MPMAFSDFRYSSCRSGGEGFRIGPLGRVLAKVLGRCCGRPAAPAGLQQVAMEPAHPSMQGQGARGHGRAAVLGLDQGQGLLLLLSAGIQIGEIR